MNVDRHPHLARASAAILAALPCLLLACSSPSRAERWRAELDAYEPPATLEGNPSLASSFGGSRAVRRPVRIVTSSVPGGPSRLSMYDVSSLLRGARDFPGHEIGDLRHPGERPEWVRSAEGQGGLSEDMLIELIQSSVEPGTWDDEDVSITIENGLLIVRHP